MWVNEGQENKRGRISCMGKRNNREGGMARGLESGEMRENERKGTLG